MSAKPTIAIRGKAYELEPFTDRDVLSLAAIGNQLMDVASGNRFEMERQAIQSLQAILPTCPWSAIGSWVSLSHTQTVPTRWGN